MSDIFEKDIDTESEDLSSLEDNYESDSEESKSFVFPSLLIL